MQNLKKHFADHNDKDAALKYLTDDLGIRVKHYPDEGLYVFNYSQIDSPKTHPIVMECRGIILDDNFNVVCATIPRFFNMGEAPDITDLIDVNNADAYEKADGSMVKLYNHRDYWHIGTRGTAFAESENYTGELFSKMILDAFGFTSIECFRLYCKHLDKDKSYIFEFLSPLNRIVTPYSKPEMVLLAVLSKITGVEYDIQLEYVDFEDLNVRLPEKAEFNSREHLKTATNDLKDLAEGFVVQDRTNGLRMKIKSDQYVAVHKLRGDSIPTPKRIINLVSTNEYDEYLSYFPDDVELFQPYIDCYSQMLFDMGQQWIQSKHIEDQKNFALKVKDLPYAWVLFQARAHDKHPLKVLLESDINKRNKTFGSYFEKYS